MQGALCAVCGRWPARRRAFAACAGGGGGRVCGRAWRAGDSGAAGAALSGRCASGRGGRVIGFLVVAVPRRAAAADGGGRSAVVLRALGRVHEAAQVAGRRRAFGRGCRVISMWRFRAGRSGAGVSAMATERASAMSLLWTWSASGARARRAEKGGAARRVCWYARWLLWPWRGGVRGRRWRRGRARRGKGCRAGAELWFWALDNCEAARDVHAHDDIGYSTLASTSAAAVAVAAAAAGGTGSAMAGSGAGAGAARWSGDGMSPYSWQ